MRTCSRVPVIVSVIAWGVSPALSQEAIDAKVRSITDALVVLCMAGGSETTISAKGDLELRSKLKDILTGRIGAGAEGSTTFNRQTWEGIIGGISKDMTGVQSEQAAEARKCMVDNGFSLISRALGSP